MTTIADLSVKIGVDADDLESGAKGATRSVNQSLGNIDSSPIDNAADSMSRLDRVAGQGGRSLPEYGTGLGGIGDRADEVDTRMMGLSDGIQGVGDLMRGDLAPHEYAMALSDIGSSVYNFVIPSLQSLTRGLLTSAANAVRSGATHAAQAARVVAGWVVMGAQATVNAVKMAAAWLIGLGPIGLVIAAIAAIVAILVALGVDFDTVKNIAGAAWDFILGAAQAVWAWLSENWPLVLAILTGPIGLAVLAIVRHWGTIKSGFTAVRDWIGARLSDIVAFFTGMPGRITAAASGMWNGITSAFKSAVNTIIAWWNGLSFTLPTIDIPGWDPPGPGPTFGGFSIGGQTFSTPNLPMLARGGILKATPGGVPFLGAEAGHDEAVIPLPHGLDDLGGGPQIIVNVAGSIRSDRDIVRLLRDELDRGGLSRARR